MSLKKKYLVFLLFFWAAAAMALPQTILPKNVPQTKSTDGQTRQLRTVQGKVTDPFGKPIAGALVILESKERDFRKERLSDRNGLWTFVNVMAVRNETFILWISAENYLTRTGVIVLEREKTLFFCELNPDPRLAVKKLFAEADSLYRAGDFSGAEKKYREVSMYDLASGPAELGCGLCQLGMGNMDAAREAMEKTLDLARKAPDPKTETAALEYLGDLMVRRLELEAALGYFLAGLELGYERGDALAVKVADVYFLQKKPDLALAYYRQALKANPGLDVELAGKIGSLAGAAEVEMDAPQQASISQANEPSSQPAPAPAASPVTGIAREQQEVLDLAARYCAKLERAAFRYFCIEDVVEEIWPGRAFARKNAFRYDFQIVGGKRRVAEKRKLLLENGIQADGSTSAQQTIFKSNLKFFAPIELLSAFNQKYYHYRILKKEQFAGQPFLLLRIEARREYSGQNLLEGSALVSPEDGSVARIEIAQGSIVGLEERRLLARMEGFDDVLVRDVHWFEKTEQGLRFPSHSQMREIFLKDQLQTLHYTVDYSYSGYKFFDVQITDVEVH